MMNNDACPEDASQRVLAWWDLDVHIGAFHKRKMTARPLKDLEQLLGHRLHVEGWVRYDYMAEGLWKFEAFNCLDTADPALAAYATLRKLSQLTKWLQVSWQGYNTGATALTDDLDKATICAFYWNPPDQLGMPRYQSAGVLLCFGDQSCKSFDQRGRHHRPARPVVGVSAAPQQRADYIVEFTAHIICGNKQDLMTYHWPRFQESRWPGGILDFEVDAHTHAGKPNIIRGRQVLRSVREHEAIVYCLSYAPSFRIKLDAGVDFHFVGRRIPSRDFSDGIVGFDMRRIAG